MSKTKSASEPTATVYIAPGTDDEITRDIERVAHSLGHETQRVNEIVACKTCGFFSCVCTARARHKSDCRFLRAAACPISIGCDEHGDDVCPICDACDCGAGVAGADLGGLQVR